MTKKTAAKSAPASVTDIFSETVVKGTSGYLMFPSSLAKDIEHMTRDRKALATDALNRIANIEGRDKLPRGAKAMPGGLQYLQIGNSGKDTKGFVFLPGDLACKRPTAILGIITLADFAQIQGSRASTALTEAANGLKQLYPKTTVAGDERRVPKTHRLYSSAMGVVS